MVWWCQDRDCGRSVCMIIVVIREVEENSAPCAYALSSIRRACHAFSQITSIFSMVCMNVSKGGGGFVEPLPLTLLPRSAAQYVMDTPSL